MIWLLVGYMWLFIHRPFDIWPSLHDLHIERMYMLATIAVWVFAAKSWTGNRITWAIVAMATAVIAATLGSPYADFDSETVQNWFKVLVFYFLVMSSVRQERDLRILVVAMAAITALYELHSLREYLCGRGEYRMGTWRMNGVEGSDPNAFATTASLGLPLLLPIWTLAKRRWQRLAIVAAAGCRACACSFTGSRSGFLGLALLALAAAMASKHRVRIAVLLIAAAPLVWAVLSDNLRNRYLTLIDPSLGPTNAQVSAQSRQIFFWMAVDLWKDNPVFGVGPGGFAVASHTKMQSHSLYAQTISELGTVGAIALLLLIGCFAANFFQARRLYRAQKGDSPHLPERPEGCCANGDCPLFAPGIFLPSGVGHCDRPGAIVVPRPQRPRPVPLPLAVVCGLFRAGDPVPRGMEHRARSRRGTRVLTGRGARRGCLLPAPCWVPSGPLPADMKRFAYLGTLDNANFPRLLVHRRRQPDARTLSGRSMARMASGCR